MKFLTFDYVDAKGKQSSRQVIQLSAPTDMHLCIDVAELEPIDMVSFQQELEAQEVVNKLARESIMAKYDVSKNYRFFKPENMTNITEEE